MNHCENAACAAPLDDRRSHARFCSPRCRAAAWREQVRRELNELDRLRAERAQHADRRAA
jgi:hypothetical protein